MRNLLASLFLTIIVATFASTASAQWQTNGVPLCTTGGQRYYPVSVSDGSGGAIVIWVDNRYNNWDIYAQRVNAAGVPQWAADGVAIGTGPSVFESYIRPAITPDGSGGAIVTWSSFYNNGELTIRAQRVDASGALQWMPDGVFIGVEWSYPTSSVIASDNAGGAIITWSDSQSGNRMFAQRVNAAGVPQWTPGGVALATGAGEQLSPGIVSDASGGAIVTWTDTRSGTDHDIYAQRVNASGVPQWAADGVALCTTANEQYDPKIASDGAGGAIVTWYDYDIFDIYAQRVNASGVAQWTTDGVALCTAAGVQGAPVIVSDGSGGAIVTWHDARNASSEIYAQRVDAVGSPQWIADGVFICTAAWEQDHAIAILSDDLGGAIVAYFDDPAYNIYAQRVSASGTLQWTVNGVALCTAADVQRYPTIALDGSGGAIATWVDHRAFYSRDLYAQRVLASGTVPTAVARPTTGPSLIVGEIYPNPLTGTALLDVELTAPSTVRIDVFDVAGRRVRAMTLRDVVSQRIEFDGRDDKGRSLPSGVYFSRVTANGSVLTRKMVIAR